MYRSNDCRLVVFLGKVSLLVLVFTLNSLAATHRVPSEFATIQAGIDVSVNGDTVLVAPGTYAGVGNLQMDFRGVDLVLLSEAGPDATVLNAGWPGGGTYVVKLVSGETRAAVIEGFTLYRCQGPFGGVWLEGTSSPTVRNCHFLENTGWGGWDDVGAAAILCHGTTAPLIESCEFRRGDFAALGNASSAITADHSSRPEIVDCLFAENQHATPVIVMYYAGLRMSGCIFAGNTSWGAGALSAGTAGPEISTVESTLFFQNTANSATIEGGENLRLVNCTITGNWGADCGGIATAGDIELVRTVVSGNCGPQGSSDLHVYGHVTAVCCAIPDAGIAYGPNGGIEFVSGRVETDPIFCESPPCPDSGEPNWDGDYHLRSDSPCLAQFSPCGELIGALDLGCVAPVPVGACCLIDGSCLLRTGLECDSLGGRYQGDGLGCYPDPCQPTEVRASTWGRVKLVYR